MGGAPISLIEVGRADMDGLIVRFAVVRRERMVAR